MTDQTLRPGLRNLADGAGLTPQEMTILALSARFLGRKEVAERCGTSPNTVKAEISAILRKCHAASVAQLLANLVNPRPPG